MFYQVGTFFLHWLQTTFDAPPGRDPCAIRMTGMGKGMVWVNGISIGRHWMSFLSPLGQPTQSEYVNLIHLNKCYSVTSFDEQIPCPYD